MKIELFFKISVLVLSAIIFASCDTDETPKPLTYMRIDIPKYEYKLLDSIYPFTFKYSENVVITNQHPENINWINLDYPKFNATVYLSYYKVDTNLAELVNDAQELAFKHQDKANEISDRLVIIPENKVYGLVFLIKGVETASALNFYLTDSVNHYLRGALYFNLSPNNDSLAPILNSIKTDMDTLIRSLRWKNNFK